jgi:hypothetical protein
MGDLGGEKHSNEGKFYWCVHRSPNGEGTGILAPFLLRKKGWEGGQIIAAFSNVGIAKQENDTYLNSEMP